MSLDLVAVQRDAALLDALSQRVQRDDIDCAADPVLGLLAALVADVDEDVLDLAVPDVAPRAPRIPQQGRHRAPASTVTALPLQLPPVGRRHAARAVAAMAVAAAVLSVGGVAAAVTGDPLTPYRNVINVVRGSYHEVMPTRSGLPKPRVVAPNAKAPAKASAAKAGALVEQAHNANSQPASRGASRVARQSHRWNRQEWNRHRWNRHVQDPGAWNGHNRDAGGWDQNNQDHRQWGGPGGYSGHADGSTDPSGALSQSQDGTQSDGTQSDGNGYAGGGESGTANGDAGNTGDGSGGSNPNADGSGDVHQ